MKIENDKPNPLAGPTDSLTAATPAGRSSGSDKTAPATSADQLIVSAAAKLLKAASDAAASDSGVRAELVEKMRTLMAEGKVGVDADQLADSLIDDVLKNR
jgi:flagellar biosynthesis anti-sigma factor FlgM